MNRRTILKGGLVLAATSHTAAGTTIVADPLLNAIRDYRTGIDVMNAIPPALITMENEDDLVQATYGPHQHRLQQWNTPAMSREGAIEALRLMESEHVFVDEIGVSMHRAVLAFLEGL
ncbi:hypothetical protein GOZ90_09610 [Agrobacterium vitis]|uniref:Uncharacterized protein n=1 Tax=Agrobacterium vitis TaxID=373 RepID=A0A6L6VDR5_AGRVI|nr:hypothetical protein [Agrobacterium vitis]MUZ72938.1 hypothetical protein [Agrobacterium vitis]